MAISGGIGADLDLDPLIELRGCSGETGLFGEGRAESSSPSIQPRSRRSASARRAPASTRSRLGRARGVRLEIEAAEREVSLLVADAEAAWRSLESLLSG